ncbi:Oxalate decarboxylase OxdD [Halomonadaceae bacterium LMG 33818]|uniref:cupin domain-containing protein n=1 Tax=Cernens ardua TaxID=3402176 RepID=UPI003EDBC37A
MTDSRRRRMLLGGVGSAAFLGLSTIAKAASFGNPDLPPEGRINSGSNSSHTDPGPNNPNLASQFPDGENPPATDVNGMPEFWSSFSNAHVRFQEGGWARQITESDFPISTEISGVNMRLSKYGIREMHWHQQAEWAIVLYGTCRITTLDAEGRPQVADVQKGDLWYFPPGLPHSLQGMGPDGTEFLIAFDDGKASEFNTLLVTDWMAHTPPEVLAKNFGVPESSFKNIPLHNRWIFQGKDPGPLSTAQSQASSSLGAPAHPFVFPMSKLKPNIHSSKGEVTIVDSNTFKVSKDIAVAKVVLKPGAMRELHWHPNTDEWQYYVSGQGRMTVFNTGPEAATNDFKAGDIGYVPKGLGHYVENTGNTDLVLIAIFRTSDYETVSLSNWIKHTPPRMVEETLNISEDVINHIPDVRPEII